MSGVPLPIAEIVGRSPLNVRTDDSAGDVEALAASIVAVGLLQPIIVRDDGRGWETLDGGRRHAALRLLVQRGQLLTSQVDCIIDTRPEAEAREASLVANVVRRQLHPIEEFEAFARLVADGFPVERVAADFNVETRFVRQRLALDKLSPRVRAAWRAGKIDADAASAFTIAGHEAQEAYLGAAQHAYELHARTIRQALTKEALRADSPEARYVGLDAYHAAGGAIDDNLFEDFSLCLDGALLKRLAREKMLTEGEAVMERLGFGFVTFRSEIERSWEWQNLPLEFTADERARLMAIETECQAVPDPDEAETEAEQEAHNATLKKLHDEHEAIEKRAQARGGTPAQRARAGVILSLSREGALSTEFAVPPKADKSPRATANAKIADLPPDPAPAGKGAQAAPAEDKKPGKALIECLDMARTEALARLVSERPNLAMLLATAVLSATFTGAPLRVSVGERNTDHAGAIGFVEACTELLGEANRDVDVLQSRFASAVAATIVVRSQHLGMSKTASDPDGNAAIGDLVSAFTGGDAFPQAMRQALDYEAYFKAATRAAAIAAVTDVAGDTDHARGLKKAELATFAAELCRDKGWLPAELRPVERPAKGKAKDLRSLATAMADALAADGLASETAEPDVTASRALYTVATFVDEQCTRGSGRQAKMSDLHARFLDRSHSLWSTGSTPPHAEALESVQAFGAAICSLGFETKRLKTGVHVLGLDLPATAQEAA